MNGGYYMKNVRSMTYKELFENFKIILNMKYTVNQSFIKYLEIDIKNNSQ